MDCHYCGMETELKTVRQGVRFTPHGIEDIWRRPTRIVVDGDNGEVESIKNTKNFPIQQASH